MQKAIIQQTTVGASPFIGALGYTPVRIIPNSGDPTDPILTYEEFGYLIGRLADEGLITADEAQRLSDEANDVLPADFTAVVETAMAIELPAEFDTGSVVTFETCDDCGLGKFRPHGRVDVKKGELHITRSPAIFTLIDGFRDISAFTQRHPAHMSGKQAIALFQSMVKAGLDETPQKADERMGGWDEETRAAYGAFVAKSNQGVYTQLREIFAEMGGDFQVERMDIPGLGSGTMFEIVLPADLLEEPPRAPTFLERLFGRR